MKKTACYYVRIQGQRGHRFSPDGFSQYNRRFGLKHKGKLKGPVYGLAQARQHADELRKHIYEERKIYRDVVFEIIREVTIVTVIRTVNRQVVVRGKRKSQ